MITITITLITIIFCIMSLNNHKILLSLEILLCFITSYFLLNLKYQGQIHLWSDSEYTQENINKIINQGIVFWWIVFNFVSYFTIYLLLKFIIKKISFTWILNYYKKKINSLGNKKEAYYKFVGIKSIRNIKKIFGSESTVIIPQKEIIESLSIVYELFCFFIHIIICWFIIGINNSVYIIVFSITFIVILLLYIIFFIPLSKIFKIPIPED